MMHWHSDLALLIDASARTQGRLREAFAPVRNDNPLGEMERTVLVTAQAAAAKRAKAITLALMPYLDPVDIRRAPVTLARIRAGIEAHDKETRA